MQAFTTTRNAVYQHGENTDYVNHTIRKPSPTRLPENASKNYREEAPDIGTDLHETQVG